MSANDSLAWIDALQSSSAGSRSSGSANQWLKRIEARDTVEDELDMAEAIAERVLRRYPRPGANWLEADESSRRYLYSLIVSETRVRSDEGRASVVLDPMLYHVEPVPRSIDEFAEALSLGAYVTEVLNHPEVRSPNVATRPYRVVWAMVSTYAAAAGVFFGLALMGFGGIDLLAALMAILGVIPLGLTAWKLGNTPRHILRLQNSKNA